MKFTDKLFSRDENGESHENDDDKNDDDKNDDDGAHGDALFFVPWQNWYSPALASILLLPFS